LGKNDTDERRKWKSTVNVSEQEGSYRKSKGTYKGFQEEKERKRRSKEIKAQKGQTQIGNSSCEFYT